MGPKTEKEMLFTRKHGPVSEATEFNMNEEDLEWLRRCDLGKHKLNPCLYYNYQDDVCKFKKKKTLKIKENFGERALN